ncbi:MAG: peptidoglycan-binding protein [Candidatus Paceibacterota bacterium]
MLYTIINTQTRKQAIAIVAGVAMVAGLVGVGPGSAQAQQADAATIAALQAQIAALQAQIAAFQSGTHSQYTFTRNLTVGSTGEEVRQLQIFLNQDSDTRLATVGAGSPGQETSYFGPITRNAVVRFQTKYASDVLLPLGLSSATGFWGPSSRAMANELIRSDQLDPGDDDDDNGNGDQDGDLQGGVGDIDDADFISGINNEEVAEGENDVEVLGLDIEADDGSDIEIMAVTIDFDYNGSASDDFDDYAEEVSVWFNGEKVAEVDADEFEDDDDYNRTVSLDRGAIIRAGEERELIIAVSGQNTIDSTDLADSDWDVSVEQVRIRDAAGAILTVSQGDIDESRERSFSFVDEAEGEDIEIRSSSNDPDSRVLLVDEDDISDWHEVFAFRLEAEENDIELDELVLEVLTGTENYNDVVNDVVIEIDGEEFSDFDVTNGASTTAGLTFNIDGDYTVDADDDVEVVVFIEFQEADGVNYSDGETVQVRTVSVEGEGRDDVDDISTVTGDVHTLSTSGVDVFDISSEQSTNDDDSTGFISWTFTVEAVDGDVTFDVADRSDVDGDSDEVQFTVTGPDASIATASITEVSGDASYSGGTYTIQEGDEAEFALDITLATVDSGDNGTYRVRLDSVAGVTIDRLSGSVNLSN